MSYGTSKTRKSIASTAHANNRPQNSLRGWHGRTLQVLEALHGVCRATESCGLPFKPNHGDVSHTLTFFILHISNRFHFVEETSFGTTYYPQAKLLLPPNIIGISPDFMNEVSGHDRGAMRMCRRDSMWVLLS